MDEATGRLFLRFRRKESGKTYVAKQYFKLPLQIMSPYYQDQDGTAFVYLLNPSGGILQHDRLYTEVVVEENARVLLTTPASTKFYKMDEGHALLKNDFTVEQGGVLEYLPEHNVPFADSKTYTETNFYLHKDATLIASDMLTAGRVSRNEMFQYDLWESKTKIYVEGKLFAYDRAILEPKKHHIQGLGLMEGYGTNGTLYVYQKKADQALVSAIRAVAPDDKVRFGASLVDESLIVVRFIGDNIIDMQQTMLKVWEIVRKTLLGKPSVRIRKY